jgi:hypothetical protein
VHFTRDLQAAEVRNIYALFSSARAIQAHTHTPMLDPLSALAALVNIAIGVWDAAQLVQQNREECRRLKDHIELLVSSIEKEGGKETPSELLNRLQPLQACVVSYVSRISSLFLKLAQNP